MVQSVNFSAEATPKVYLSLQHQIDGTFQARIVTLVSFLITSGGLSQDTRAPGVIYCESTAACVEVALEINKICGVRYAVALEDEGQEDHEKTLSDWRKRRFKALVAPVSVR